MRYYFIKYVAHEDRAIHQISLMETRFASDSEPALELQNSY